MPTTVVWPERLAALLDGLRGRSKGNVYVYHAQPSALLAVIDESGRYEAEYVIDPAYLSDDVVHLHE